MSILIINVLTAFLFSLCSNLFFRNRRDISIILFLIVFVQIVMTHALVDIQSVPDLPGYENMFQEFPYIKLTEVYQYTHKIEYGYYVLNRIVYLFSHDFRVLLITYSLLYTSCYFISMRKYSDYFFVSVLFMLLVPNNQAIFVVRQHLAIAVLLLSFPPIIERKFWRFLFWSIIGVSLHQSALIWLPIYFIYGIQKNKCLILSMLFIGIALTWLFANMALLNESFGAGYGGYIAGDKEGESNLTSFAIQLLFLIVYCYFLRKDIFCPGIRRLTTVLLLLSVIGSFVGTSLSLLARLMLYYRVSLIFAVPLTLKYIDNLMLRFIYLFSSSFLYFIVMFYGSNSIYLLDLQYIDFSVFLFLISIMIGKLVYSAKRKNNLLNKLFRLNFNLRTN